MPPRHKIRGTVRQPEKGRAKSVIGWACIEGGATFVIGWDLLEGGIRYVIGEFCIEGGAMNVIGGAKAIVHAVMKGR